MESFITVLKYFINPLPGREFKYYWPLSILVILLVTFAIYLFFYIKKHRDDKTFRRLFRNYPGKLITAGFLIGAYIFCRYELISILSARVVMYLVLAYTGWLIYGLINTYLNKYPAAKKLYEEQILKSKYLPGKKKRN